MNTRLLELDDAFKAECKRLREFAEDPKNWYVLGETTFVPGDKPEYVLKTEFGFRIVFTITHALEHGPQPFRHLSLSVSSENYPHPLAVYTIAHYLGFTGGKLVEDVLIEPGEWAMEIDREQHCIVVQQPYDVPAQ